MGFALSVLVLLLLVGGLQVFAWYRHRMFASALLGTVYLITYPADLLAVASTERAYLSPTISLSLEGTDVVLSATVSVTLTWIIFSIGMSLLARGRNGNVLQRGADLVATMRFRPILFVSLVVALTWSVIRVIGEHGVEQTLRLRQAVFGDDLLSVIAYYALPVLVPFGLVALLNIRGFSRTVILAAMGLALVVTFLTGSRSGLFLSCVVPVAVLVWRLAGSRRGTLAGDGIRLVTMVATAAAVVLGGAWYLGEFRDFTATESFFASTDLSQADALAAIIGSEFNPAYGASYVAALGAFIPRAIWPSKPLPGNVLSSLTVTPERYHLTGAETTAGLVGEAYLNFGMGAGLVAGLILVAVAAICERLLSSASAEVWILGAVIMLRGVNIVRGDATNVVAPTLIAIAVWLVIFKRDRSSTGLRGRSLVRSTARGTPRGDPGELHKR
ncbi:O-antigen polymerase [Agromyces sp. C10]|uniref:O-antigen polymerase n=1 Tax=Agromyces sp. C10 TaxID=2935077 RepID=UPI00200AC6B1|nr:O-antigen polymerase [Agromyces sp. C10]MCK8608289.1 oligosaccharide repeat unit polymerase [Agromyces sp. C10]